MEFEWLAESMNWKPPWIVRALAREEEAALDRGDLRAYLDMHGSHERLGLLAELEISEDAFALDPQLYWQLLGDTRTGAEFFHGDADVWRDLLSRHLEGRAAMMAEDERAVLAGLPDPVTVWRGVSEPGHAAGFSWSLDREKRLHPSLV